VGRETGQRHRLGHARVDQRGDMAEMGRPAVAQLGAGAVAELDRGDRCLDLALVGGEQPTALQVPTTGGARYRDVVGERRPSRERAKVDDPAVERGTGELVLDPDQRGRTGPGQRRAVEEEPEVLLGAGGAQLCPVPFSPGAGGGWSVPVPTVVPLTSTATSPGGRSTVSPVPVLPFSPIAAPPSPGSTLSVHPRARSSEMMPMR
jgi:hypothetical protein